MEEMTMGKRIAFLRKRKGFTQEQLAERLSVSPQAVSKWENDLSCPDISILPRLADQLGVSTDALLGVAPLDFDEATEPEVEAEPERKIHFETTVEKKMKHDLLFPLLLILVGFIFLLDRTGLVRFQQFQLWGIVWPAVLLGLGVAWMLKQYSPFGFGLGLLGLYYLLFNLGAISYVLTWSVVWPFLLILLGVSILFEAKHVKRVIKSDWNG